MIYPVPQKNLLNGLPLQVSGINALGEQKELIGKVLSNYSISQSGLYTLEVKISNTKCLTYIDEISKVTDEKYILTVSLDGAVIESSSEKGAFYGLNTFCKLAVSGELRTGEIEDYPLFTRRGYIEGFYGHTWAQGKRLSVMSLMARYGMNTYCYAPKDDLYHREKWRELYPEKELSELKALFDFSRENYMEFFWCIGPGLTYKYTSEQDFQLLINKIKSIYDIGVKNIGLLLDDIPWEFQYSEDAEQYDSIVDAHIDLVNKTYNALKEIDSSITLVTCPTQYSGDEKGYYISKFGQNIPGDVSVFWTGQEICSRVLTVHDTLELVRSTGHKPLFWDNFPVNDCEMFQEMHMGAIMGRDKELYKYCEGIISNVMEYAECSKVPLLTIADYLWNPSEYFPEDSLNNAHKEILGDKAELFRYFADHLGVSCLTRYSSALMSETLSHINFLRSSGDMQGALKEFKAYNQSMRECLEMLQDESVPIFAELKKWVKKFSMCCDLLDAIYNAWESPTERNFAILKLLTEQYNADGVALTGFCLREAAEKTLSIY